MPERQYIRLHTLKPPSLPSHPALKAAQTGPPGPQLVAFVEALLSEAAGLINDVPALFKVKSNTKSSAPASAKVQLLAADLDKEPWFARRSTHANQVARGTGSWEEFRLGIFEDHSIHEMEYTPDVFDAHRVLSWNEELRGVTVGQWGNISISIYEMCHSLPFPLYNRVFPVLVLCAESQSDGCIVVQIPVDVSRCPETLYANGRHRKEGDSPKKRKRALTAVYTSIERIKLGAGDSNEDILWEMATTSDAKGWLPMGLQKLGVPSAVVKDVGFLIGWLQGKREV